MLWLETVSSFGSSFIGHSLPRGCDGAISTLCLERYGQARGSRFSLGLSCDLHWLEQASDIVGWICAGLGPEVGQINR